MKRLTLLVICLLTLSSCRKEQETLDTISQKEEENTPTYDGLTFELDTIAVKMSIDPSKGSVVMSVGDEVSILYGKDTGNGIVRKNGNKLYLETNVPGSAAGPFYAVYPAGNGASLSGDVLDIKIPRVNDGKWQNVCTMAAKTDRKKLSFAFKHACSYLSIDISEADIQAGYNKFYLARASGNGRLYGSQKISFSDDGQIVLGPHTEEEGEYFSTLQYFEGAGTYFFPLIAGLEFPDGLILCRVKDKRGLLDNRIQSISRGHIARCGNVCERIAAAGVTRYYIKPGGTGNGSSWEKAADMDFVQRKISASTSAPLCWVFDGSYFLLKGDENYRTNLTIDSDASFMIIGCYEGNGTPGSRDTSAYKTFIRQKDLDRPIISITGAAGATTLYGLTLCDATGPDTGSALHVDTGAEVRIRACTFKNNVANRHGGALDISGGANVFIYQGCRLQNNRAKNGGVLRLDGAESTLSVTDSRFFGNRGESTSYGGGCLYLNNGTCTVSNCSFEGNDATNSGGAARITGGTHNFNNVTFNGNSAGNYGGAVCITGGSGSFNNTRFTENSAANGGGIGAYGNNSSSSVNILLQNGEMSRNTAVNTTENMGGGAIYMSNGASVKCDGMTFSGNKVVSAVNSRGGAICIAPDQGCALMVNAGVFKGNGFEITGSKTVLGSAIACQNSSGSSRYNDAAVYNSVFTDGYARGAGTTGVCAVMMTGSGIFANSTAVENTGQAGDVVRFANIGTGRSVLYNSIILDKTADNITLSRVTSNGYILTGKVNTDYVAVATDYADASVTPGALGLNFSANAFGAWNGVAPSGFSRGATATSVRSAIRSHGGIGIAFDEWLRSLDAGIYSLSGNGFTRTAPFWPGAYQTTDSGGSGSGPGGGTEGEPGSGGSESGSGSEGQTDPQDQLASTPLSLTSTSSNHLSFSVSSGIYNIRTTGNDPYVYSLPLATALGSGYAVVSFDYTSSAAVGELQIFYCDPVTEERSRTFGTMPASSSWKKFSCLIALDKSRLSWGKVGDRLRFDFGSQSGVTLCIRNLRIRVMSDAEQAVYTTLNGAGGSKATQAQRIANYLNKSWPCSITSVSVGSSTVTVKGTTDGKSNYYLADIAPYENPLEMSSFTRMTAINGTSFSLTLPRTYSRQGYTYDSLLSRWAVVSSEGGLTAISSHARYADEVTAVSSPAKATLKTKKGLAGLDSNSLRLSDIDALKVGTVTMNIVMDWMINTQSGGSFSEAFYYGGRTYYINSYLRSQLDQVLKFAYDRGIVVCAILLFNVNRTDVSSATGIMRHPEYISTGEADGRYTMPNMTTAQAVHLYAALVDYLAKRYASATFGRIHHWILHNEVDYAREWTNMGDQPQWRYMDSYVRSMRLCYNIVRQYDQNASAMISLTHCWNKADGQYKGKSLLDDLLTFSAREGDFRWGVAHHPYPQNLLAPKFWAEDTQSTYSATSSYCTFKNLEVLSNWALDSKHFYKGAKRTVFLTENGTNSPTYSQSDLILQAAGACWAWKKVKALSGIDGIHWHNWRDDAAEGGLLLGLRSAESNNSAPKQAYVVWRDADTSAEDATFAPYLSVIGIPDWNSILHPF